MGLFNIDGIDFGEKQSHPSAAYGRLTEASMGKDTTIGHWEISGIISKNPLPTYPHGFPKEVIDEFEKLTGRKAICNMPYSGTQVIEAYGKEQLETGALIVYTSADSVFQIAANKSVIPLEELYDDCKIARKILNGKHGVGRVIARPFEGTPGNFHRTPERHDFSVEPPQKTMLDLLIQNNYESIAIGKIYDIFAHRGITQHTFTHSNSEGMELTAKMLSENFTGLCFTNLVDFDMLYGHRNDIDGYAQALSDFDKWIPSFLNGMNYDDLLIITADHGCDPATPSTDHSREQVPLIAYSKNINPVNLGTMPTYSYIAQTVLDNFLIDNNLNGKSFLRKII
jgi:phosphopentomutase